MPANSVPGLRRRLLMPPCGSPLNSTTKSVPLPVSGLNDSSVMIREDRGAIPAMRWCAKSESLKKHKLEPGREPINLELSADVRFGAHNGLKRDIAPCRKSANSGSRAFIRSPRHKRAST
jgi:hypothetical protein